MGGDIVFRRALRQYRQPETFPCTLQPCVQLVSGRLLGRHRKFALSLMVIGLQIQFSQKKMFLLYEDGYYSIIKLWYNSIIVLYVYIMMHFFLGNRNLATSNFSSRPHYVWGSRNWNLSVESLCSSAVFGERLQLPPALPYPFCTSR